MAGNEERPTVIGPPVSTISSCRVNQLLQVRHLREQKSSGMAIPDDEGVQRVETQGTIWVGDPRKVFLFRGTLGKSVRQANRDQL